MPKASIVNVVATASLSQSVDLNELGKLGDILHDANTYRGMAAYLKSPDMKGKISIFSSGKMISVGTRSEKQAIAELEYAKDYLVQKGFVKSTLLKPRIRNIVVVADLKASIDLEKIAEEIKVVYEPEQFPGAILKLSEPNKVTVLLFASGKAVLAGLRSSNQINPTLSAIADMLR